MCLSRNVCLFPQLHTQNPHSDHRFQTSQTEKMATCREGQLFESAETEEVCVRVWGREVRRGKERGDYLGVLWSPNVSPAATPSTSGQACVPLELCTYEQVCQHLCHSLAATSRICWLTNDKNICPGFLHMCRLLRAQVNVTRPQVCPPTTHLSPSLTNEKNTPVKFWRGKKREGKVYSLIPVQIKFLNARFLGSQSVVSGLFF